VDIGWTVTPSCTSVTFRKNLEDYDHGHGHEPNAGRYSREPPASSEHLELPGEMLAHRTKRQSRIRSEESLGESLQHDVAHTRGRSEPARRGDEVRHTSKKNVNPIRTNRLRKILPHAKPTHIVHRPASVRELPVIAGQ